MSFQRIIIGTWCSSVDIVVLQAKLLKAISWYYIEFIYELFMAGVIVNVVEIVEYESLDTFSWGAIILSFTN